MKKLYKSQRRIAPWVLVTLMMVSGCSTSKSVSAQALPPNLEQPCEVLQEITETDAVNNQMWPSDMISKYNRCVIAKDAEAEAYQAVTEAYQAVVEAYQLIYKETLYEKP